MANFFGTALDDLIRGTNDADMISGLGGNDRLRGRSGNDSMFGGDGNDRLDGENGNDMLVGGAGVDDLNGGDGADWLEGGDGNDDLNGNLGLDQLWGGAGDDKLSGEEGNDILDGGAGNDRLEGGIGDDYLYGGAGRDTLTGGAGADVYAFDSISMSGATRGTADWIRDFSQADGDSINLSAIDATGVAGSAFNFIGNAGFSGMAGELRYEFVNTATQQNTMVYCDTNGDGAADFAIRLTGNVVLDIVDFTL